MSSCVYYVWVTLAESYLHEPYTHIHVPVRLLVNVRIKRLVKMELAATLAFSHARASKVDLLEQQVHQLTQELVQWESHHKEFMNAAMSTFLGQQDDLIEELHRRLEIAEARLVQYDHQQVQQYQSGQGLPLGGWAGGGRAQEDLRTMRANSMQGGAAGSTGPAGSAWGRPASAGPVGGAGGGSHMNGQNAGGGGGGQFWR